MYTISGKGFAKRYVIIWPEKRAVTAKQIHDWYTDAVDNGEILDTATSIDTMAEILHGYGTITLADQ